MKRSFVVLILGLFLILGACGSEEVPGVTLEDLGRSVPEFSAEQAFSYIETQLGFGPRVPGTPEHVAAMRWKTEKLRVYASGNVYVQEFQREVYGRMLPMYNIIAAFNPHATDRILLAAHWDTRPRADQESDPEKAAMPIPGADDGASGTAVLMELARIMSNEMPPLGVDIILFDGEDYGREGDLHYYFLGARQWAAHPPVPGYRPRFGILLDMVGAKNATFPKEGYSLFYAGNVVHQIWDVAAELGYDHIFIDQKGEYVLDDHWVINEQTDIRMLNIIHHRTNGHRGIFPDYWHTHKDDIDNISKETLQAVGNVLTEILYNRLK